MKLKFATAVLFTLAGISLAETNIVRYVKASGVKTAYDIEYDMQKSQLQGDGSYFFEQPFWNIPLGIGYTTNSMNGVTNINQLADFTAVRPDDYYYGMEADKAMTPAVDALLEAVNERYAAKDKITREELKTRTVQKKKAKKARGEK